MKVLKTMRSKLPTHAHSTSIDELGFTLAQVEELHQKFYSVHEYFESAWPAKCVDHEYFETEVAAQEAELVWDIKLRINRLREDVETLNSSRPSLKSSSSFRAGKLPELTLPTFSGIYTEWPGFSELFSSLIIKDTQLAEIDKLHYLRSSLSGEPSKQVNAHPMTGSSFQTCWEGGLIQRRWAHPTTTKGTSSWLPSSKTRQQPWKGWKPQNTSRPPKALNPAQRHPVAHSHVKAQLTVHHSKRPQLNAHRTHTLVIIARRITTY